MNRAGLLIALALSLAFVVLYLIFPELDLQIAGGFYDAVTRTFPEPLAHRRGDRTRGGE